MSVEHGPRPDTEFKAEDSKPSRFERAKKIVKEVAGTGLLIGAAISPMAEKPADAQIANDPLRYGPRVSKQAPRQEKMERSRDKKHDIEQWMKELGFSEVKVTRDEPRGRQLVKKHLFTVDFRDGGKDMPSHAVLLDFFDDENLNSAVFCSKLAQMVENFDIPDADKQHILEKLRAKAAAPVESVAGKGSKESKKPTEHRHESEKMAMHALKDMGLSNQYEVTCVDESLFQHMIISRKGQPGVSTDFNSAGHIFGKDELGAKVQAAVLRLQNMRPMPKK